MASTASKTPTTPTRPTRKNPATTTSPVTGKRQGPPRKPLTTVVGTMGTRTPQASKPARKPVAQASKPAVQAKATPASRELPRDLVTQVAKLYAKASPADRQRVANYLKVVTTGTDAAGNRWWPDDTNLPRPTHFSWAKASK
jgi:hypothetical protein